MKDLPTEKRFSFFAKVNPGQNRQICGFEFTNVKFEKENTTYSFVLDILLQVSKISWQITKVYIQRNHFLVGIRES